ncbi:MAG: ArnT family glycosyltransferase [Roseiflexaceae bacterium]
MQRIHRESRWYIQYLYPNQTSTKYFQSILLAATSTLPVMLLFQSILGRFELISTILLVIATGIGAICLRLITAQQGGPYIVLSGILALLYTLIGSIRWGIQPAYFDFWGGLLSFVLSMIVVIALFLIWLPNHSVTEASIQLSVFDYVGMAFLFMASVGLRWYQLDTLPAATNFEAIQSLQALATWQTDATNPIALTPDMTSQLMNTLQGVSMFVFGETISGARNISVIIGSIAVLLTFLATRMFFDARTAWITAIVLLAMSSHIEFSRLAIPVIVDTALIGAILYAIASAWSSGQRRWYLGAGLLLSLTQYSYHTGKIIPVIFALWLCMYAIQYWQDVESRLIQLTSMWGIAILGALPHWMSIAQQWQEYIAIIRQVSIFDSATTMNRTWLAEIAAQQQLPEWHVILLAIRDAAAGIIAVPLRDQYEIGLAMLTIPAAVVFVFGLFIMVKGYSDPRYWLLFIGMMSGVAIAAITINTPAAQRMIYITPFVAMVVGIGIAEMGRWFKIDWIQQDWHINPIIIQVLSFVLAITIAGYDTQAYLGTTRNALTNPIDQSANAISIHAQQYPAGSTIYLFTQPELYYHDSALIKFKLPQITGVDVYPPLTTAPPWQLGNGTSLFVFNQSRLNELSIIKQYYPGGNESRTYTADGQILLVFYEVLGVNTLNMP